VGRRAAASTGLGRRWSGRRGSERRSSDRCGQAAGDSGQSASANSARDSRQDASPPRPSPFGPCAIPSSIHHHHSAAHQSGSAAARIRWARHPPQTRRAIHPKLRGPRHGRRHAAARHDHDALRPLYCFFAKNPPITLFPSPAFPPIYPYPPSIRSADFCSPNGARSPPTTPSTFVCPPVPAAPPPHPHPPTIA
jgi:hypothetical protein